MLLRKKIYIAAIQATHIPKDLNYKLNGYRIITSAAIQETDHKEKPTHEKEGSPQQEWQYLYTKNLNIT